MAGPMPAARKIAGRMLPFSPALVVFLLDRITKSVIQNRLTLWDNIVVIPGFFNIVHAENPGAAFSILADSDSPLRTLLLIALSGAVILFISFQLWQQRAKPAGFADHWTSWLGLSLVLGGAAGNLYDRILVGTVTDFLEFYRGPFRFPAFNAADSGITVGAGLLILSLWLGRTKTYAPETH